MSTSFVRFRHVVGTIAIAAALAVAAAASDQARDESRIEVDKLGPQVGATVPGFTLPDQNGRPTTLQSIMGPDGAMIVFFRSADW